MASKILTRMAIVGWILAFVGPVLVIMALNRYTSGEWPWPKEPQHNMILQAPTDNCQYPTRPLVNGQCDNSDPACPETIKIDGGDCSSLQEAPGLEYVKPLNEENFDGK